MKTRRNLWPQLISWENLLDAYRKCRRRKRYRRPAAEFEFAWESELLKIQSELTEKNYRPGPYRNFVIREPKTRIISAAPFRDRVVHHAIVNVLEPIFEPTFIYDSYACRKEKGTHAAVQRTQKFLRQFRFLLKSDIVKFFPNIDHAILHGIVAKKISDDELINLVSVVLESGADVLTNERSQQYFPGDDLFALLRPCGLPIGNLTSQFFANVLLNQLDHFIKEDLRAPGYVRYADDFIVFGNCKRQVHDYHQAIRERLACLRLRMHKNKSFVAPTSIELTFLGFRISRDSRRLSQDGLKRVNRNLRRLRWKYKHGKVSPEKIRESLGAWKAHADFANSQAIQKQIRKRAKFRRSR